MTGMTITSAKSPACGQLLAAAASRTATAIRWVRSGLPTRARSARRSCSFRLSQGRPDVSRLPPRCRGIRTRASRHRHIQAAYGAHARTASAQRTAAPAQTPTPHCPHREHRRPGCRWCSYRDNPPAPPPGSTRCHRTDHCRQRRRHHARLGGHEYIPVGYRNTKYRRSAHRPTIPRH